MVSIYCFYIFLPKLYHLTLGFTVECCWCWLYLTLYLFPLFSNFISMFGSTCHWYVERLSLILLLNMISGWAKFLFEWGLFYNNNREFWFNLVSFYFQCRLNVHIFVKCFTSASDSPWLKVMMLWCNNDLWYVVTYNFQLYVIRMIGRYQKWCLLGTQLEYFWEPKLTKDLCLH